MDELTLTALITAIGAVLVALVQVLGKRVGEQVAKEAPELTENEVLLRGIRRHIPHCNEPSDLIDLL